MYLPPIVAVVAAASLAFNLLVLTPATAQDNVRTRGELACKSDARHCKKYFSQGDAAILACLQERKVQLSASCRKFLTDIGQLN